ncbi:MAG: 4-(cytidine 5'-diphospho)-2-C-methyl-D-erythritol kinase, partial [Helicobacter sp.]|nr:4-(cytidine 5'-diphospho)-2-C-methyl-D-erythritol kinase [Helicobacter sp.]
MISTIQSFAKVNLFLKITGKKNYQQGQYHTIFSRFMIYKDLYDEMEISFDNPCFDVLGDFDCPLSENTIYKAYKELLPYVSEEKKQQISHLKIEVQKKIPSGGGLGGGSSNAASFLKWVNDALEINLSQEVLVKIGQRVGSDVAFFISGFEMAHVSGRGEILECYQKELPLKIEIINSKITCCTSKIYSEYAKNFFKPVDSNLIKVWESLNNHEILKKSPLEANDLLAPLLNLYP